MTSATDHAPPSAAIRPKGRRPRPALTPRSVAARLRRHGAEIRQLGVDRLILFGSVARGAAKPGSDVDLAVDSAAGSRFSLLDLVHAQRLISDVLGAPADLVMLRSLMPDLRQAVDLEGLRIL